MLRPCVGRKHGTFQRLREDHGRENYKSEEKSDSKLCWTSRPRPGHIRSQQAVYVYLKSGEKQKDAMIRF